LHQGHKLYYLIRGKGLLKNNLSNKTL